MAMIDIGIRVEISKTAIEPTSDTDWDLLDECLSIPQLLQQPNLIDHDVIGNRFITQIAGKRSTSGMTFGFAFNGGLPQANFRKIKTVEDAGETRWMRVVVPYNESDTDVTEFRWNSKFSVSNQPINPSGVVSIDVLSLPQRVVGREVIEVKFPTA